MKAADAIKLLEEASTAEKKATASRAQSLADVEAARVVEAKVKALIPAIKNLVSGSFGKKSPITAEFGFGPQQFPQSFGQPPGLRARRVDLGGPDDPTTPDTPPTLRDDSSRLLVP